MEFVHKALAFIVCLGVLIAVHEWGHFWVARRNGVKVLKFSIGFGKSLFSWTDRHGTEFVIAAIPLGGYVKMLGEPGTVLTEEDERASFAHKKVSQRFAIVLAGPVVNLIFAVILYWALFVSGMTGMVPKVGDITPQSTAALAGVVPGGEVVAIDGQETTTWEAVNLALVDRIGDTGIITMTVRDEGGSVTRDYALQVDRFMSGQEKQSPLDLLGIQRVFPLVPPEIGKVMPGKAGDRQGLQEGDIILSADGTQIQQWKQWVDIVRAHPGESFPVELERSGQRMTLTLMPDVMTDDSGARFGQIGVGPKPIDVPPEMVRSYSYSPVEGLVRAVEHTGSLMSLTLKTLGKMVTGSISLESLSGPITIARLAGESAVYGLESFLSFTAYLSISLGVLNLLPIPVLDGGHLMFYLVEWIRGRPVSERVQQIGQSLGLGLLLMFMGLALYNDVLSF
jgi:regulator of sigma E protease